MRNDIIHRNLKMYTVTEKSQKIFNEARTLNTSTFEAQTSFALEH